MGVEDREPPASGYPPSVRVYSEITLMEENAPAGVICLDPERVTGQCSLGLAALGPE